MKRDTVDPSAVALACGHFSAIAAAPILLLEPIVFSSLFALLSLTLPPGTQPAQPLTIPPSIAQMVMVDAFVTDRKGRSIADLQVEDFELLEDNRPIAIVAFQPPKEGGPTPASSPTATTAAGKRRAPEHAPITLVIYVDRWLLSASGRKRALDQAAALAESHIAQGARVTVIADDKGLRPLTPLTTDPGLVRAALTRIQGWATESPGVADGRTTLESIKAILTAAPCDCVCMLPQLISAIRFYAVARVAEVQKASDRLTFLVNALLGVTGRKSLVYVSEGLEQRPGIHLYDQLLTKICPQSLHKEASSIFAAMQEFENSPALREVAARANAARVTLYPLDARGLQASSIADISQTDRNYVASARTDMIRDANLNNPLHLLGEETGGFAMLRGLDPQAAMRRFDADERGHYVIGFVPGDADGKIHSLRVRLNERAHAKRSPEIRHRQAYLRAELPARRGQRSLSTLLFGLEENALEVEARVERTKETAARVHVSVALAALEPAPGGTGREARVQVVLSFRKAQDEKSPVMVREKEVTFSLSPEAMVENRGRREIIVEVSVSDADYEFAIGVEDRASGAASHLRRWLLAVPKRD